MDSFTKRAIFYICLVWGIAMFFIIPYSDGIHYWDNIYEEAQRSIKTSESILNNINNPIEISCWLEIDARGAKKPMGFSSDPISNFFTNYYDWKDILVIQVDSISLEWFDTIKIIRNDDTFKIALEDL